MSPFLFIFFFFLLLLPCNNSVPLFQNGETLASFRKNLHSRLSAFETWNISFDPSFVCSWSGISCDGSSGRVDAIDLSNLNISGTVELAGHDGLVNLSLDGNKLVGFLNLPNLVNLPPTPPPPLP